MHSEHDEVLLTAGQVADLLGVSRHVIRWWIRKGILPAVRIGRHWRISPANLEHARQRRDAGEVLLRWQNDPHRAGARLRHFREAAGLSQLQLSSTVGLSNAALSILEQGHRVPRIKTIRRLIHALDITAEDLVADTPLSDSTTMSASDVASYLGVPLQRVRSWIGAGLLPGQKISRSWRIPRAAVLELEQGSQLRGKSRRRKPTVNTRRHDDIVAHSLTAILAVSDFTNVLSFLAA